MEITEFNDGNTKCPCWRLANSGWADLSDKLDDYLSECIRSIAAAYPDKAVEWVELNYWPDTGRLIVYPSDSPFGDRTERVCFQLFSDYLQEEFDQICEIPDEQNEAEWDALGQKLWDRVGECVTNGEANRALLSARVADPTDNTVRGLDSAIGKLVWICPGPIPRAEDNTYLMMSQLALLGAPADEPPFIYHGCTFTSRCRQAAFTTSQTAEAATVLAARGVSAAAPVLEPGAVDARWQRGLPWATEQIAWSRAIAFVAWAMFFSVLLVVIPAAYLIRIAWLRRFGLKTLLVLPVVAALFLTGALTTGPAEALEPSREESDRRPRG
jgi:hypothetical protein